MRRLAVINYSSRFLKHIGESVERYNRLNPDNAFSYDIYESGECSGESMVGDVDAIIHSGGDGIPVKEDTNSIPRLYICFSHQWKARQEGGEVVKLKELIKGVKPIDVLADDRVLGKKGRMPIMQYHEYAVVKPPRYAQVLATSRAMDTSGKDRDIIEALRYATGDLPQEGWQGFIPDSILRSLGIQLVDGRISGVAVIVGAAPNSKTAVKIIRALQEKNILRGDARIDQKIGPRKTENHTDLV